ncbi:CLUMA_CG020309, isoform A [Clunio marinus]|uniref:CLUMA_CG020309, isoform A n=1 Tax=Clunio marinus TaxID=568069 RepID=A0A1J1J5R2_9DIPT|nr:CLUMA_CG020309, isoform A [Clunio marinus]
MDIGQTFILHIRNLEQDQLKVIIERGQKFTFANTAKLLNGIITSFAMQHFLFYVMFLIPRSIDRQTQKAFCQSMN